MKQILTIYLFILSAFLFSQNSQLVEIETNDGNIFLGTIIEENEDGFILKTQDGIQISVPTISIKNISKIETAEVEGQIAHHSRVHQLAGYHQF